MSAETEAILQVLGRRMIEPTEGDRAIGDVDEYARRQGYESWVRAALGLAPNVPIREAARREEAAAIARAEREASEILAAERLEDEREREELREYGREIYADRIAGRAGGVDDLLERAMELRHDEPWMESARLMFIEGRRTIETSVAGEIGPRHWMRGLSERIARAGAAVPLGFEYSPETREERERREVAEVLAGTSWEAPIPTLEREHVRDVVADLAEYGPRRAGKRSRGGSFRQNLGGGS